MSRAKEAGTKKLHFEPSTIENIDRSVLSFLNLFRLHTETNTGFRKVPVVWGTAERTFQSKYDKEIRDSQGMLILPIITVRRTGFTKNQPSKGIFQGNVPEDEDEQGGSLDVSRVIYQEKTMRFASADSLRLYGQSNYPRPNPKIVYRTVSVPMPVNVEATYEIVLRTEYQQQMNDLLTPFITAPGTINYVNLKDGEHRYEGFIQPDFSSNDNISDFSGEERKFETKITLKVVGYLIGEGKNREKAAYSIRENAVEVKIPRERVTLSEIPEHEYGEFYGLAGVPSSLAVTACPSNFFFSNVPAIGGTSAVGSGTASNVVTRENFVDVLSSVLIIREMLKEGGNTANDGDGEAVAEANKDGDDLKYTLSRDLKENTEALYRNGLIQAVSTGNVLRDYSVSGNIITIHDGNKADDPAFIEQFESLYITYLVGD